MNSDRKSRLSQLGLLLVAVIWGSAFVVVKNTTDAISTNYILFIRFFMAAIVTGVIFHRKLRLLNKSNLFCGVVLGVLIYLSYYIQTVGIQYTTAGNNAFLTATYVVLVPFIYWLVRRVKPDAYNVIAAVLCLAGIGFISLQANFSVNIGDLLSTLCGISFATHIVFITIFTQKHDPILLSILQFFFCSILGLINGLFFEPFPGMFTGDIWLALIFLGVFSTAVALVLQTVCQKYLPAAKASLIMSLESVFGCLAGAIFLQETLSSKVIVGFILVFLAVIISETKLSFFKPAPSSVKADTLPENKNQ